MIQIKMKGKTVANLTTNDSYKNDKGEKVENKLKAQSCCLGKTAENHRKYVTKGKEIAIDGKLMTAMRIKWRKTLCY
jgi:single-strand DNA-binding protein